VYFLLSFSNSPAAQTPIKPLEQTSANFQPKAMPTTKADTRVETAIRIMPRVPPLMPARSAASVDRKLTSAPAELSLSSKKEISWRSIWPRASFRVLCIRRSEQYAKTEPWMLNTSIMTIASKKNIQAQKLASERIWLERSSGLDMATTAFPNKMAEAGSSKPAMTEQKRPRRI